MSSSVKTLITVLVFNLIIGIVITAGNTTTIGGDEFDYAIGEGGQLTNKIDENFFEETQNDNLISDAEYGNSYAMGKVIWDLLRNGIISIPKLSWTNPLEMILSLMIIMFRTWLYMLFILQIYRLYKNRT